MTAENLQAIALDPELQQLQILACQRSPWYWLVNYVVTLDEHYMDAGAEVPYRRFPPKVYLRSAAHLWFKERYTAWPKSRQMMMTWLFAALYYGDAIFLPGRLNFLQSKKEPDAVAVLKRVKMIDRQLRTHAPWMAPRIVDDNETRLAFANDSRIQAVPEGAHQIRSYTPTGLLMDEAQEQPEAEQAFEAALACCQRITIVGTADQGWMFQVLLQDKVGRI